MLLAVEICEKCERHSVTPNPSPLDSRPRVRHPSGTIFGWDMLQIQDFGGAQGQTFDLDMGTATITLTLDTIAPLPVHRFPGMMRDPFSLLFRSSSPVVLPQRIYKLSNQRMGDIDVFLVPIARDVQGIAYQAVFN